MHLNGGQNGTNVSSVAPSSKVLLVRTEFDQNAFTIIVQGFLPKTKINGSISIPSERAPQEEQNDANFSSYEIGVILFVSVVLLTGRCYEAETGTILLLLRWAFA